ncbi:MAG: transposase, partial [Rhodanobacteraceae bacterium]
ELVAFINALNMALYQPQIRHLIQMVDALLTSNETKTISGLYRLLKGQPDPKSGADFLRESPWEPEDISGPRKRWMVMKFLELARKVNIAFEIFIGIDDSLGKKGNATRHLEAVDYHHNHSESSKKKQAYANGYVYVEVHVQIGPFGFLFDTRLFLREKTVRRLNRARAAEKRLHYRSKYALARQMLVELETLLPKGHKVYVLFDSWYASKKLIKFCRRQKWHVICAIKSNRRIDKVRVDQHNLALRHKPYERITLEAVDEQHKAPTYFTRLVQGHLEGFAEPVHAIISKKRPGDKFPKYFVCTDLSLTVQQVLRYYQKRWPVEVDNTYLKNALGLGDFRLQSLEATQKWFAVVMLALNYLQYRLALAYSYNPSKASLADFIRQHRLAHFQSLLRTVLLPFAQPQQIETCLQDVFTASPWAVV